MHCLCKVQRPLYLAIVCYLMSETLEWDWVDKGAPTFPFSLVNRPPPVTPHPIHPHPPKSKHVNKQNVCRLYHKMQLYVFLLCVYYILSANF